MNISTRSGHNFLTYIQNILDMIFKVKIIKSSFMFNLEMKQTNIL